jgi:hypothetical protein
MLMSHREREVLLAYSGILTTRPGDRGIRAAFALDDQTVTVTHGQEHYSWGWDEVRIAPWDTTTVRLQLPDGELFYRADDPLRFAEALERAISPAQQQKPTRWWDSVFGARRATAPARASSVPSPRPAPSRPTTPLPANPPGQGRSFTERAAAIDLSDPWAAPPAPERPDSSPAPRTRPRRRRRRRGDHVHRWAESTVSGGIVRRICEECRHVSIDLRSTDPATA